MKYSVLMIVMAMLTGACNNQVQQARKSSFSELIKGDWAANAAKPGRFSRPFMSFEDSSCTSMDVWKYMVPYRLKNDTLILELTGRNNGQEYKYAILQLNTDSLTLLAFDTTQQKRDTVKLTRLHQKNNIAPDVIYFASGPCFGACPSMAYSIDSQRNIIFFGSFNAESDGGYRGKLSMEDYQSIVNKIRLLPVDSLHEGYKAPWTDDQTCGMMIKQGDKLIRSAAYGFYDEPIELRLLLNRLIAQSDRTQMQKDTSITYDYFNTHPDTAHAVWRLLQLPRTDTARKFPPAPPK